MFNAAPIALTLLEPAVEKPQPLIDIDWTVFIQFGIFVVMMAVLWTMVFRPYLANLAERARRIDGAKAEARSMQERAATMMSDYDERLVRAKQKGAEQRLKLRAEGQAYERDVLGRARLVGQQALDAAKARSESQRQAARGELQADAQAIGQRIAARVLGQEVAR